MSTRISTLGIDAGATLSKIVSMHGDELRTQYLPSGELQTALEYISRERPERVVATGGGASAFQRALGGNAVEIVPEFQAWSRGVRVLAERARVELPPRHLLVSLGTGTSVLLIDPAGSRRVGGTALGGGTLCGLGKLLLGTASHPALCELAARGDRRSIDLLVSDIYVEPESPLPPDLNASSFAKLTRSRGGRPEDLAHALIGLIGENIALICGHLAQLHSADLVVFCGSTLQANPALEATLDLVTRAGGRATCFLDQGAYCGAIGAASWDPT